MKILGYNYTIIKKHTDNIEGLGYCKATQLKIEINETQAPQQLESTMLHEMIHALDYHFHLGLNEQQVMSLEAGLYQSLTDNGVDLSPLVKELSNE